MYSIFKKEIRSFLSSLIAYVVIIVFLLVIGLFTWVFADGNVLSQGYSNLDVLFFMAPWVFIFLISAITMRSFSEEIKQGTFETLSTKPITDTQIILGKFLASVVLVIFAILPTLLYFYSVYQLGLPKGNIDVGATWGSYIGLVLLGSCYCSIGVFASAVTPNQIVSFILSMFLCFFFYVGFQQMSNLALFGSWDSAVQSLGIQLHYDSISRGVVDTRDLVYFGSLMSVFLGLTYVTLGSRKW
ncbi:gliding motility-associated ABC transporter permease subunit GldF [Bacteroidia bacterium]|jgi:ABC-2 type transport system permease protein|nr:gliding motility-associated ABC transporter permease subunit GldF [Bacteroidia bacterium]MDA9110850.1 gliding motility-associated ABC transporter permease subunit GldF [Bacteroidia bacterium]MDB4173198.1 gliding motility-associated ABC transporter permease subunit GldF [Bacteroidia bacterium]